MIERTTAARHITREQRQMRQMQANNARSGTIVSSFAPFAVKWGSPRLPLRGVDMAIAAFAC